MDLRYKGITEKRNESDRILRNYFSSTYTLTVREEALRCGPVIWLWWRLLNPFSGRWETITKKKTKTVLLICILG